MERDSLDYTALLAGLQSLRSHVVEERRAVVMAVGEQDSRIKRIVEYQDALRAIDAAIEEEQRLRQR